MAKLYAIVLACWSLFLGPALCAGDILAHPCECSRACDGSARTPDAAPSSCPHDPCQSVLAENPSATRDENADAPVCAIPVAAVLATLPDARSVTLTVGAAGSLFGATLADRDPLLVDRVLPLLI